MDNQEIANYRNPVEYLKVFFRRRWLFVTPVFIGLVLGIVASFMIRPTYESSTVILVEEEKIINPLIQGLAVSTSVAQRMRTIKEQILSWSSLVSLTNKLNLAKNVDSQAGFEGLIMNLRKNIVVTMRGPNLIKISYYNSNPQKTLAIAKTLTDVFIEENMRSQSKETDVAIDFIKDQLEVYKRKIKESEIGKLEDDLRSLLVDSTEAHPMVKELRQRIAIAKKELEAGDYKVSDKDLPIATPAYEALKQELDKMTGSDIATAVAPLAYSPVQQTNQVSPDSVYKLLVMDKLDSALGRDMRVNENIYNMLLQKLETAKITKRLEASKEGTRYTIVDPPRLPLKPSKPNKLLVIFIGIFLGGFLGTGLVFGKEFLDQSFLDIDDAKNNLELPVLGAISRLTTQEEIEKEKLKQKKFVTIGLSASGILILIVMLISFFRK
ncbi:MAG: hypothetical protein C4533_02890 [Candidatus Omnitrophota bacterium]|jgi:capsular polysaccharide biosynthesis protein|nr:MAG: hypothetical protein C4533_02890 [Candidatus Omnitrophota bacterium]